MLLPKFAPIVNDIATCAAALNFSNNIAPAERKAAEQQPVIDLTKNNAEHTGKLDLNS